MPIHNWTRVRANRFHDFHQRWTIAICNAFNAGRLPPGYFATVARKGAEPGPDIVAIERMPRDSEAAGRTAIGHRLPMTRFATTEAAGQAKVATRIPVRDPEEDVVAVVGIVSPENKNRRKALRAFARNAVEMLQAGIQLLIVDLFPPSRRRDPQGIHKVIWDCLREEAFELPPDKPLTLAAYAAGGETVAYVEPVAVGDALPVFLTASHYVPCPLEETYRTAWEQFPAPLKGPLEAPPT